MDRTDLHKGWGNEARQEKQIFCPKCSSEPHLFLALLDSLNGKQYRLFECECGEMIWDDSRPHPRDRFRPRRFCTRSILSPLRE